ncbi:uncharacterized protein LOC110459272 [Mizuhopecten yessoensis]|uniref:Cubilin n=1 Tax=Mizuhopecten yessoensis TaxID=6573 RepID=A0A210Q4Z2_MIZYE|nr:uncharacterized protein LOC110459272 [Mizuhopecten yessoensis]OWF43812.1 cubilin [Mizuhopecten yessoensis]
MECSATELITSANFIAGCYIFLCLFTLGTCSNKCPEDEEVSDRLKYLTSYKFPDMYSRDLDCEWRLTSKYPDKKIKIKMKDIKIEYGNQCEFDYLEIFDGYDDRSPSFGRFCGADTFSIVSSGIYLYFHFHTDEEINERGFKFTYCTVDFRTISSTYPPPIDRNTKTTTKNTSPEGEPLGGAKLSTLVGGVLGGLCLLVVIIAVCCMCSTRCCRRCSVRNNGRERTSVSPQHSDVDIRPRDRSRRRPSPSHVSPFIPRRAHSQSQIWSLEQNIPMVPINPPPYSETESQPVYLVHGPPGCNPYFPPCSPPPTYSFGLSSDSNPPAYEDDRNSPPNYVPYEENPPRY